MLSKNRFRSKADFLASYLIKIYDQDLCSLLDMHVFRIGASSSTGGEIHLSVGWLVFLTNNKLLLTLTSTVILGSEFYGTHGHILVSDSSGSLESVTGPHCLTQSSQSHRVLLDHPISLL
jgi:hypothetical protein